MELNDSTWDAIIVGAGPAGAISAYLLAKRGWRTLLLEKSKWPREKVCGGCLNARALQTLHDIGITLPSATRLHRFLLHAGKNHLEIPLPEGLAISRAHLDAHLVHAALSAGATFLPEAAAKLHPANPTDSLRHLTIMHDQQPIPIHAQLVLACDGINGTLLDSEPWATWHITRNAWFGVSATINAANLAEKNTISMYIGTGGYIGAVTMPDHIHIGAALDPITCRTAGGPAQLIARILHTNLDNVQFRGTGLLTRHRKTLGGHRILAVGDACGYVEPFTGEGISWAIRGAKALVEILPDNPGKWTNTTIQSWQRRHAEVVHTRWCRTLRWLAHRPAVASAGIALANLWPAIGQRIGNQISGTTHVQGVGV